MPDKPITYPVAKISMLSLTTAAHKLLGGTDNVFSIRPDKTRSYTAKRELYSKEVDQALLAAFSGNYKFSSGPQEAELNNSTKVFFDFLFERLEEAIFIIQRDADMFWLKNQKFPALDYICLFVSMIALNSVENKHELVKTCPFLYLNKSIKAIIANKGNVTQTIKKTIKKYLDQLSKNLPKSKIALYNKLAKFDEVTNQASTITTVWNDIDTLKKDIQDLQSSSLSEEQEHLIQVLWGNYNALLALSRLRFIATKYHLGSEKELLNKLYEYAILSDAIEKIQTQEEKYLIQEYKRIIPPNKKASLDSLNQGQGREEIAREAIIAQIEKNTSKPLTREYSLLLPSSKVKAIAREAIAQVEKKISKPLTREYSRLLSLSKAKSLAFNKTQTEERVNSYIRLRPILHFSSDSTLTTERLIAVIYPFQIAQMLYVLDNFEKHDLPLLQAYPLELESLSPVIRQIHDCLQAVSSSNKEKAKELILAIAPKINEQPHFLRKIIAVLFVGLTLSDKFTVQHNSLTKYIEAYLTTSLPKMEFYLDVDGAQAYIDSYLEEKRGEYDLLYGLLQMVGKYNQLIIRHELDVNSFICNPLENIELFLQKFFEKFNAIGDESNTHQRSLLALKNLKTLLSKAKITGIDYDIFQLNPYMLQQLQLAQFDIPDYAETTWIRHFLHLPEQTQQDMLSAFKERLNS